MNLGRRRQTGGSRGGYRSRSGRRVRACFQILPFGINERPARVVSGVKSVVNGLGGPGGPLFKIDDRFVWSLHNIIWNRQNGGDQAFVPVRIFREDLHDLAIGLAICELEHVLTRRERFPGNLHRGAELEFCSLVPLIRHYYERPDSAAATDSRSRPISPPLNHDAGQSGSRACLRSEVATASVVCGNPQRGDELCERRYWRSTKRCPSVSADSVALPKYLLLDFAVDSSAHRDSQLFAHFARPR